jgi:Ribbon-helix-helix protein, copG family
MYTDIMGPMTRTQGKPVHKKRGRPPGVRYAETIPARFELEAMKRLDLWAKQQKLSRSEAIRQLVELGLKARVKQK